MKRLLRSVLDAVMQPMQRLLRAPLGYVARYIARALITRLDEAPKVMGMPVLVNAGNERDTLTRVEEVLKYVARSPRHFAQVRRAVSFISVGGVLTRHGKYWREVSEGLHVCDWGTRELFTCSVPSVAATVVFVAVLARLNRTALDLDGRSPEWRRRALLLCDHTSKEFLDYAQSHPRAA